MAFIKLLVGLPTHHPNNPDEGIRLGNKMEVVLCLMNAVLPMKKS